MLAQPNSAQPVQAVPPTTYLPVSFSNFPPYPTFSYPPLKYPKKAISVLGLMQIAIGILFIVFGVAELVLLSDYYLIYHGEVVARIGYSIWLSVFYSVPGLLGFFSSRNPKNRLIISFMVMCIIAAVVTASTLSFGIIDAVVLSSHYNYSYRFLDSYYGPNQTVKKNSLIAISAILAILSCIEAVIAIICSALCCRAVCCCKQKETYIQLYDPATQSLSFIPIARHQNVMIAPFNIGAPCVVGQPNNMEMPYNVGQAISIRAAHNFDAPLNVGDSYNVGSQDPPMDVAPPYQQIVGGLQNNNLPPYADKVDEIVDNKAVDAF